MRAFLVLAALGVAIVIGCRGLPQPNETPRAHDLHAGQLRFVCDFELPADHRLVRELAAERHEVAQTLGLAPTNEPIVVYLFSDAERYRQFLSRYFPSVPSRRAFFIETDTTLAVYAHWSDRVAEDLRHEVAHGYLHSAAPGIPLWLDEGLAEYFEVPRGYGGLNRPHLDLLSDMATHGQWQPNLAKLEQLNDAADMEQIHYAEAWAWVYFLLNTEPRKRQVLTDYLAELSVHGRGEPLSNRLAALHFEPERTLTEYLAELPRESETR
jgi:hypothetical protein